MARADRRIENPNPSGAATADDDDLPLANRSYRRRARRPSLDVPSPTWLLAGDLERGFCALPRVFTAARVGSLHRAKFIGPSPDTVAFIRPRYRRESLHGKGRFRPS